MFEEKSKLENLYHALLINTKKLKIASKNSDLELRKMLLEYGSFLELFKLAYGPNKKIEDVPGYAKVLHDLERIDSSYGILTIKDEKFPTFLKNNPNNTPLIYYRGDLSLLEKESIGVVGTRELEEEVDISEGKKIVQRLVEKDYVIVSGLAKGCDTLAHQTAIDNKGKTIAVLGTPLNHNYPYENKSLQEKIAQEHLLISQYPIGINIYPSYFAHRNNTTVSLSSEGVVVIRAGDKSGTQHAIRTCLEQEKQLYALMNNYGKRYEWIKKYHDKIKVPNNPPEEKNGDKI